MLSWLISMSVLGGLSVAVEEPSYAVIEKKEAYEIREYPSVAVAETEVTAEFSEAGNQAFRLLADYIFGNNQKKTKIAMTAPVSQQPKPESQKMAMTAPVTQSAKGQGFVVQFTMPKEFSLETLPTPNDARVKLRQLPGRRVAVRPYSGSWSQSRYEAQLKLFQEELAKNNIKTVGEPTWARYNSPFSLWFLRRNEIWYELPSAL